MKDVKAAVFKFLRNGQKTGESIRFISKRFGQKTRESIRFISKRFGQKTRESIRFISKRSITNSITMS